MLYTPQTLGYPARPPRATGLLPPGGGRLAVPHPFAFASLYMGTGNAYRSLADIARKRGIADTLAIRNDPVIFHALRARQMPTAQLAWHIDPQDATDPRQAEAARIVEAALKKMPRPQQFNMHLLEALFYGRYAVQVVYRWQLVQGHRTLVPVDFVPVNGDKLRFRYDGQVGVAVHSAYPGTTEVTDFGLCHFLTPDERQQFVIHKHEPEDADYSEPEFAGQVHGVGLRSRLYWVWWLKANVTALMLDYLERYAKGTRIIRYPAHDTDGQANAQAIAEQFAGNGVILIPTWIREGKDDYSVTVQEMSSASPALLQNLVTDYYDGIILQTILGQELSSTTAPTGLGSGVANAHMETLARIIKYDAVNLDATKQSDLVEVIYRHSFPGVPPGTFVSEVDEPNAQEVLGNAQILKNDFQAAIDVDHLLDICKLPKPASGDQVAGDLAAMQPAAVQGVPEGVPVAGATPAAGDADQPQTPPPVRQSRAAATERVRHYLRAKRKAVAA